MAASGGRSPQSSSASNESDEEAPRADPNREHVRDVGLQGAFQRHGQQFARRDENPRAAVLELLSKLARRVQRVDRRDCSTEARGAVERDSVLGQIRAEEREHISVVEAVSRQPGSGAADQAPKLAIGQAAPRRRIRQRNLVGAGRRMLQYVLDERNGRNRDPEGLLALRHGIGQKIHWRAFTRCTAREARRGAHEPEESVERSVRRARADPRRT